MQNQFSPTSPVSPLTPSPSERPSQRFFTSIPTAHNYPLPPKFPPRTSSLLGGIQQPIPSHPIPTHTQPALRYPQVTPTFTPRPWNTILPHSEYSMSITSMKSSQVRRSPPSCSPPPPLPPPPLPPPAPPSLPLPITTTLTTSLPTHLGRRRSRTRRTKKLSKWMTKGGSSTNIPPRNGTIFTELNNPYNYHHQFNSSPALAQLPNAWASEGEETEEEITPNLSSAHGSHAYLPKSLSSHVPDGGVYGQVVSGEGTLIPRISVVQSSSNAASPVSSAPTQQIYLQHSTEKRNSLELLLALFREHNTMVRIVRWLRKEDLYNLVTVSKLVREGILLPPMGLGFDRPVAEKKILLENITRVIDGDDTDDESDKSYQLSPLSPISPLEIKVGSVIISHSPGIGNSVGPHAEHLTSKTSSDGNLPSRPWNDSGEFITTDQAFEDDTPPPPDLSVQTEYSERLGRLVWLLTLTARCITPHRRQQGKEKLKFCVWCGECVCADCDISPYISHSRRLRRLCFDCWRLSGSGRLNTEEPHTLGSSTSLTSPPISPGEAAKARNLLCTCKQGDEWVCPDCGIGDRALELDEFEDMPQPTDAERGYASSKCRCWVCGKELGGGASKWNTPAHGGMGYAGSRGEDIYRLCLWCGKRMMAQDG